MNIKRIFANAIARRVAFVLVAAAFAWLGMGTARAQDMAPCTTVAPHCDQGQAYAAASASPGTCPGNAPPFHWVKVGDSVTLHGGNRYGNAPVCHRAFDNTTNTFADSRRWFFDTTKTCSTRAPITSTFNPKSGSVSCNAGCEFAWFRNADGTSTAQPINAVCSNEKLPTTCTGDFFWNATLKVCEPTVPECKAGTTKNERGECAPEACPAGMVMGADNTCTAKENECPAGNVKSPSGECLPGDGQCAAGEARRPNGTCGKDSDGDGEADEDDEDPENDPDKETASGGDTCAAPPSCSGGAIACMQVKIQWRIDCNTRKNRNVSGGSCSSIPVCTGEDCDALEYSQLLQQWKASCALEKLASTGLPGGGGDDGDEAMEPVSSGGVLGDDGYTGADGTETKGGDLEFDESGHGWGSTCPTIPNVSVLGNSIEFDTAIFCDWMKLGGVFVMIMAYLAGLAIVVRSA